jgi:hypothetical protein
LEVDLVSMMAKEGMVKTCEVEIQGTSLVHKSGPVNIGLEPRNIGISSAQFKDSKMASQFQPLKNDLLLRAARGKDASIPPAGD